MRTIQGTRRLREALDALRRKGRSVGFVPTMGALHEGHLSLVRRSRRENGVTVASIFVNPLQFGPKEDYARYPRPLARDKRLLAKEKTGFLFAPTVREFYPDGFQTTVKAGSLAMPLCGRSRPAHFTGVCTVVLKLLNAVGPCTMYVGLKDYQQFRVLERMVKDLGLPVSVVGCPIVREKDGLAMSSRNAFLPASARRQATAVRRAVLAAGKKLSAGAGAAAARREGLRVLAGSARRLFRDRGRRDARECGKIKSSIGNARRGRRFLRRDAAHRQRDIRDMTCSEF
jgi:pantoate--beta-alanine ligase